MTGIRIDAVDDHGGLRGIKSGEVHFEYPVSVLVGKNGSGKTTILHLAALAYGKPEGATAGDYRFNDFFSLAYKEPAYTGFNLTWRFSGSGVDDLTIARRSAKKWMHYERREQRREVRFIGVSRISAPSESKVHRNAFSSEPDSTVKLNSDSVVYLSRILKAEYGGAETQHARKYELPKFSTSADYSGFNMGTGEGALVSILTELQEISSGGLLLIEEVELGLHPSASRELARVFVQVAEKKHLQIICTSHSSQFIDALPRQSRVLLSRTREGVLNSFTGATTRTAISGISDEQLPELRLVCEDALAEKIIKRQIGAEIRRKVQILTMGGKSELCRAAKILSQQAPKVPTLIVWDSEATDNELRNAARVAEFEKSPGHAKTEWYRFPSGANSEGSPIKKDGKSLPPERAIKETLLCNDSSLSISSKKMGIAADELAEALRTSILADDSHHGLFYEISHVVALDVGEVTDALIEGYLDAIDLQPLVDQIERMLIGSFAGFELPKADGGSNDSDGKE